MRLIEEYNYRNDPRVRVRNQREWYVRLCERGMTATVAVEIDDERGCYTEEQVIGFRYEVCPTCGGKGAHVNPSIDASGLSAEDFAEDPDFAEEYFGGGYDVECYGCHGQRVVAVPEARTAAQEEVLRDMHREWEQEAAYRAQVEAERRMGA